VLEPAAAPVAIQCVGRPTGHEEVGPAIVVDVADGDPVPIAAGERGQAGGRGRVLEPAVATVAEEAVSEGRTTGGGGKWAALDRIDIEPAVAVEVDQAHASAHGFGHLAQFGWAVI